VAAVRTEREAGRYDPLKETHRRVAEEEEERRLAEQGQASPVTPQAKDDHDPASREDRIAALEKEQEEKVWLKQITPSDKIRTMAVFDNQLVVEMNIEEMQRARDQQARARQPQDRENSTDRPPETLPQQSAKTRDPPLERLEDDGSGRVPEEQIEREAEAAPYEITGRGEMTDARAARLARLRGIDQDIERENRHELAEPRQQAENLTDRTDDRGRDDASHPVPEKQIEREAEAAAYEVTGRGEMTNARAARLARLRGIDQEIERETRDEEGKGVDRSNDPGDRSR
jgi:hypothetical protein